MNKPGTPTRVVSWNLCWRFGGDWRQRQPRIVTQLQTLAPDIVGLQEVWANDTVTQADILAEHR
ncbi:MAG: hypothetical protein KY460_09305 [Actinobacteria bacterium]|nr:hypothetical protein [Actinomycetota bacterium]